MEELAEADYEEMDPGIRETVRYLRAHGFNTTDSGDGKTKFPNGPEEPPTDACAMPMANVAIYTDADILVKEADRLCQLLQGLGIRVGVLNDGDDHEVVEIQAGYDPVDGSSVIVVMFLDDEKLAAVRTFS